METKNGNNDSVSTKNGELKHSLLMGQTSQGAEIHATPIRLTRFLVVFELYNPSLVLRTSEVLSGFKIVVDDHVIYNGRAVVSSLVNTGAVLICEATLEDAWLESEFFQPGDWRNRLREDFTRYMAASQKLFKISPEFKVAVADLQMMMMDLRLWLEQLELWVRSQPTGNRLEFERDAILSVEAPIVKTALQVLERFEAAARKVEPDLRAAHMHYMKRQIHPLVLCSPFIYRSFCKPLGYAGDYEMVNMMVRDPYEGGSVFAKIANRIFLSTPPVEAHRNRLTYLTQMIRNETLRVFAAKRQPRIFNLGCGPAIELQDFQAQYDIGQQTDFTLVDFNQETLTYASGRLNEIQKKSNGSSRYQVIKKGVNQLIKEATRVQSEAARFDMVYCAGLFDYFPDNLCKKLMNIFYDMLAPGGLLVVTNVSDQNPSRNWMEYVLDWNLIYRSAPQLAVLRPESAQPDQATVCSVGTGVNISLEVRKPNHA